VSNLFHWRAKCTNFKLVGARQSRDRDAEGVKGEGNGEGVSPSPADWAYGEHRKLPQRGPGHSPGRKRVLVYFRA